MASRLLRTLELLLAGLAAVAVVLGAIGLLYLLRPATNGWPGPGIPETLPLDQLAHHDAVRLPVFVLVWGAAGLALGALAYVTRIERLTAGLIAAFLTWGLLFSTTALSIFVVDQVPSRIAVYHAWRTAAIYLAAALAGLAGASLGRRRASISSRAPLILGAFVAVSGILDVVSAMIPGAGAGLATIENVTPNVVPHLARALVVPTGIALVLLARGLRRRWRRAWQLTTALVIAAALLHILNGLEFRAAIANTLLATVLIARRHDFERRGDPSTRSLLLARLLLYSGGILLYGAIALWLNRLMLDRSYTLLFALRETAKAAAGIYVRGSSHITGDFGEWFPLSVFLLAVSAALSLLWSWLAPWRSRLLPEQRDRARAHAIVSRFASDTLCPFALRADKSYFFSDDDEAFLAYTVVAGVAVVAGDPVGPDSHVEPLLREFIEFAHERGWRVGILGAGQRYVEVYRGLSLRVLYHGDEAVVETADFSLEGRTIRKVRQSVARLERSGYSAEIRHAGELGESDRAELEEVAAAWRGGDPERGFTMELDTLFRLDGDEALFVIGRDGSGAIKGFLHFAAIGRSALSLSSMPRLIDTPNGFNEWLVVEALAWAKEQGFPRVSLNFAPFAAVFADEEADAGRRLMRTALETLKFHFQLDNLLRFNRKFQPSWQPRYVVYEHLGDLPRVGIAGLAAEGYLSLPGIRR